MLPRFPENLYVVDAETGGLTPGEFPLIEVAYGPVRSDELTVLWNRDFDPFSCDPKALEINRCHERGPAPGSEVMGAMEMAARIASDLRGKVLVAANPQFDAGHMAALLLRFGLIERAESAPWSYRLVELKSLAAGFLAARGELPAMPEKGWGQADVAAAVPVPAIPAGLEHTAPGDVIQLRAIVRYVLSGGQLQAA